MFLCKSFAKHTFRHYQKLIAFHSLSAAEKTQFEWILLSYNKVW